MILRRSLPFLLALVVGAVGTNVLVDDPPRPLAASADACDQDGVAAGYATAHAGGRYVVSEVSVSGIAEMCSGDDLSVALLRGPDEIGRGGPEEISSSAVTLPIRETPSAQDVDGIQVTIEGEAIPIGGGPGPLPSPSPSRSTRPPEVTQNAAIISPNGDGVFDSVRFEIVFEEPAAWAMTFTRADAPADAIVELRGSGSASTSWDGRAAGHSVPEGSYLWTLKAFDGPGFEAVTGRVEVDLTAPLIRGLRGRPDPFVPGDDARKRISFSLMEEATGSSQVRAKLVKVRDGRQGRLVRGRVVHRWKARTIEDEYLHRLRWNGRNAGGGFVRPGRIRLVIRAADGVGNTVANRAYSFRIARRK